MTTAIMGPHYERVDSRGRFVEILADGSWEAVIHGSMRAGAVIGNHYHKLTRSFIYLLKGQAQVDMVRVSDGWHTRTHLTAGKGIYLEPNEAHAVRLTEPAEFILLKSRRYDEHDTDTHPYVVEQLNQSR